MANTNSRDNLANSMAAAECVDIVFRVEVVTTPGETVCLTGKQTKLGQWNPYKAVPLTLEQQEPVEVWSAVVSLPAQDTVYYRYFVCSIHCADEDATANISCSSQQLQLEASSPSTTNLLIRRWETFLRPRRLLPKNHIQDVRRKVSSIFGYYDGKYSVTRGWLTTQTEIRLNIHSDALTLWKSKHKKLLPHLNIKVTPIDLRYGNQEVFNSPTGNEDEASNDQAVIDQTTWVEYAILGDDEECTFTVQGQHGCKYSADKFTVFRVQRFRPEFLAFMIELYNNCGTDGDRLGFAYVLPQNLQQSKGYRIIPMTGMQHLPIGTLRVEYVVIRPLQLQQDSGQQESPSSPLNDSGLSLTPSTRPPQPVSSGVPQNGLLQDMSVSYQRYWKKRSRPVDIGHKGMGTSYGHSK